MSHNTDFIGKEREKAEWIPKEEIIKKITHYTYRASLENGISNEVYYSGFIKKYFPENLSFLENPFRWNLGSKLCFFFCLMAYQPL